MRSLHCHCQPPSRVTCSTNDLHVQGQRVGTKAKYWSRPTEQWVLHPCVIATVGTPWPKYSCHCLSLRVPLLASSQVILVSQLSVLFFGSHFPSTLTKGTFTEALCFPASPEKRLCCILWVVEPRSELFFCTS